MSTNRDEFRVAYIDAFCWRGEYRVQHDGPGTRSQEESDYSESDEEEDIAYIHGESNYCLGLKLGQMQDHVREHQCYDY